MDVNDISTRVGKDGELPSVACNVRILLVDNDTTSLLSIASQLEQQSYKVTTIKSANDALLLFKAQKSYYNIVIVDRRMPEMEIYEFVKKLQHQEMNIPIILMDEDITLDLAKEALDHGVSYIISKPLSNHDIATLWQHIYRMTGEVPSSNETKYIGREIYGYPTHGSSCDGTARDQEKKSSKRKLINTDLENKRKRSQPNTVLRMMNEPGLTLHHISSHVQKTVDPVMSTVDHAPPIRIFLQGQTSGTANFDYIVAGGVPQIPGSSSVLKAPNFLGYTIDDVNERLKALNYSDNNTVNAIITSGDFPKRKGSGEVQIGLSIDQNHNININSSANIGKQPQVIPQIYGHVIPASGHTILTCGNLTNSLEAPNNERAGAIDDVLLSGNPLSNGFEAHKQEPAYATGDVILPSGMRITLAGEHER